MNALLLRDLENLRRAPIGSLRVKYREVFGEEPRSKHREQLFRRLAWRLQALVEGELSERARQRADEIGNDADLRMLPPREWLATGLTAAEAVPLGRAKSRHDRRIPVPGTQLSRDYRGNSVVVNILAGSFEYQSRQYRSLSAIATEVTGTRWNGLAFFGLTGGARKGVVHAGKR